MRKPFQRTGTDRGRLAALVCTTADFLRESLLAGHELDSDGLEFALRVQGREPFWGANEVFAHDPVVVRVAMADDIWELAARPSVGWKAAVAAQVSWFLLGGLIIVGLLAALAWLLARRHSSLTQTVSLRDRELRAQHVLLQAVVEGANDVIFIKDLAGRFLMVNDAFARLFGRPREAFVGKDDLAIFEPADARDVSARDHAVMANGQTVTFEETRTIAGRIHTYSTVKTPYRDASGAVVGIIGVARDVTEAKRHEEALRAAELRGLRAQRLEALGTLAGGIAHDINNALAPIVMAVDALRADYPAENELLDVVGTSAHRAAEMVKQLLGFARGRDGQRVPLQVGLVISELRGLMTSSFPKNIDLVFRLEADLPLISGDSTQVLQVLTNLCVNARDAMPEGGTLRVQTRRQHIDEALAAKHVGARAGEHVVITVADTGQGISAEVLERIYEPFFSTKGSAKGTGLGLSTALGLVRGHDGFMVTESTPGAGTTVSVYLPVCGQDELPSDTTGVDVEHPPTQGGTVLFADDEPLILKVVDTSLSRLGYRVLVAQSGEEALRLVDEYGVSLVAIVTDVHMPKMNGLTFLRTLRGRGVVTPMGVVSGGLSEQEAETLLELGVECRLDKPFVDQDLGRLVAELVASRSGDGSGTFIGSQRPTGR